MVIEDIAQTNSDELNPMIDPTIAIAEAEPTRLEELIHVGQKVFVTGEQSIGQISDLVPGNEGPDSYLVIRTPHFWGQTKLLPVELVSRVGREGVQLSIDRSTFHELPNYKTDADLTNEVEKALWDDEVLKVTDYHEIGVRVRNGIIFLTGYITGAMNQGRIENAVDKVQGSLGIKIHFIADDILILEVSKALAQIQRIEGNSVFAHVQNGVVSLSGKVISENFRNSAELCAVNVAWVRGVINNISAPEGELEAGSQPFVQPKIGEKIYFRDSLLGIIQQVVINPNNKRVTAMIIQGQFPDEQPKSGSRAADETQRTERLAVVPVGLIRFLTGESGFLLIDSTETGQYKKYDPADYIAPNAEWVPPYPYSSEDVRIFVE